MAAKGRTSINVTGLERFRKAVHTGLRSTSPSILRTVVFKQWGWRWRSFSQERYDRFSRGSGDWADLKPETKAARRHGKGGRFQRGGKAQKQAKSSGGGQISILRNTNTMYLVFSPVFLRLAGQLEEQIPLGIKVGFGGSAPHPNAPMTVSRLAEIHDQGLGNNPQRKLVVDPPLSVKNLMAGDMERGLQKIIDQSQVRDI